MKGNEVSLWKERSKRYDNLSWVRKKDNLQEFIDACELKNTDIVLDIGCGTGAVTTELAKKAMVVIGLDISKEMTDRMERKDNVILQIGDIRNEIYGNNTFDKITARSVFHHILENLDKAIAKCYQILKPNGMIVIAEGIPPHEDLRDDYINIFNLKEKRIVFMPSDLITLLRKAGFSKIRTKITVNEGMCIRNLLDNDDAITEEAKKEIFNLYTNSSELFKKLHNLRHIEDDIKIDMKIAIITAVK